MAMKSEFYLDRTQVSPCCGRPVLLERRYGEAWGGRHPMAKLKRCGQCGQTL